MPTLGAWIAISAVTLLFVICVIADRRDNSEKFITKFSLEHPFVASCGGMHVSKNNELIWESTSGREIGYKVWKLSDVGYITVRTGEEKNTKYYAFRILGRDRRPLGGKFYTSSRRPVLQHAKRTFELPDMASFDELADFVIRYGDNVVKLPQE